MITLQRDPKLAISAPEWPSARLAFVHDLAAERMEVEVSPSAFRRRRRGIRILNSHVRRPPWQGVSPAVACSHDAAETEIHLELKDQNTQTNTKRTLAHGNLAKLLKVDRLEWPKAGP